MPYVPHPRISLAELCKRYPDRKDRCSGFVILPYDLAQLERTRKHALQDMSDGFGPAVATDVVLWRLGPPKAPYHTKFGGAPYRPADAPWPRYEGREMIFVAQWCFHDSQALVPPLPGDLLLLFADVSGDSSLWLPGLLPGTLHLEWQNLGIDQRNQRRVIPERAFPQRELHAVLCRSFEYPLASDQLEDALGALGHSLPGLITNSQATRIGGSTWFIQGRGPKQNEVLLATLSSIQFTPEAPDPFLDRTEPLSERECQELEFSLGDTGCIYIFLGKDGQVRVSWDCY